LENGLLQPKFDPAFSHAIYVVNHVAFSCKLIVIRVIFIDTIYIFT